MIGEFSILSDYRTFLRRTRARDPVWERIVNFPRPEAHLTKASNFCHRSSQIHTDSPQPDFLPRPKPAFGSSPHHQFPMKSVCICEDLWQKFLSFFPTTKLTGRSPRDTPGPFTKPLTPAPPSAAALPSPHSPARPRPSPETSPSRQSEPAPASSTSASRRSPPPEPARTDQHPAPETAG
jgi:hypothetical protein